MTPAAWYERTIESAELKELISLDRILKLMAFFIERGFLEVRI